ncbi:cysteine-rich CWC family protein [Accumulibacter sp.]|uniref:cysteine-rich CWC family protein n=1 Tax=Accumulibacter sp. TaxID=2053492 RepID=UPI003446591B
MRSGGSRCARCGCPFTCGMLAAGAECWCSELPPLAEAPTPGSQCYCRDCLEKLHSRGG